MKFVMSGQIACKTTYRIYMQGLWLFTVYNCTSLCRALVQIGMAPTGVCRADVDACVHLCIFLCTYFAPSYSLTASNERLIPCIAAIWITWISEMVLVMFFCMLINSSIEFGI